jgi:hypothetical protein
MSDKKHIQTEWIVEETVNGAVVQAFNSGFDAVNLMTLSAPFGALKYKHTYTLKVRFKDEKYGWGAQLSVPFTTSSYGQIQLIQKIWNERSTSQKQSPGAVSANGKRIALGTFAWYRTASWGYVDIYDFENGSYVLKHTLQNTDATIAGYTSTSGNQAGYGKSVALSASGNRLFVGCTASDLGSEKGRVFVYDYDGTTWVLHSTIIAASGGLNYADCMRCSDDGSAVIVRQYNGSTGIKTAVIYVYNPTTSAWVSKTTTTIGNTTDSALEMSGDGLTCVVGNSQVDSGLGAVYIYTRNAGEYVWTLSTTLKPTGVIASHSGFGYAYALSRDGSTLLVATGSLSKLALYKKVAGVWTLVFNKTYTVTDIPLGVRSLGWSMALDETGYRGIIGDPQETTTLGTVTGVVIENDAILLTGTVGVNTFQNPDITVAWNTFNKLVLSSDGTTAITPNTVNRVNDPISQMPSYFIFRV